MAQNQCRRCQGRGHNRRTCPVHMAEQITPPRPAGRPRKGRRAMVASIEASYPGLTGLLGHMPDTTLSAIHGVSRQRLYQFRKALDIPARYPKGSTTEGLYLLLPSGQAWQTVALRTAADREAASSTLAARGYHHAPVYSGSMDDPLAGVVVGTFYTKRGLL